MFIIISYSSAESACIVKSNLKNISFNSREEAEKFMTESKGFKRSWIVVELK